MKFSSIAAATLCLGSTIACRAAEVDATGDVYDGRWLVNLVCPDTQDRHGLVKGYRYTFAIVIAGGELKGQYGTKDAPASASYTGTVARDGTLEIQAIGSTGQPDYAVGKVARGTNYSYTMAGRLEHDRGQAERRETRACTASLARM